MWIILIDHSGSMGDGFETSPEWLSVRDRQARESVKLAAAIESVLIDLERLPRDMQVALFGFTSKARLLHADVAGAKTEFEGRLAALQPRNGTDIATVLDTARAHFEVIRPRPPSARVLLVTDGLSDVERARHAAQQCARAGLTIDVVLIDPTDRAREMAGAIAGAAGGRWDPVFGPHDLTRVTTEAAKTVAAQLQRAQAAVERATHEAAEIHAETVGKSSVEFTASHPAAITPDGWHPLYVHLHHEEVREQLKARLDDLNITVAVFRCAIALPLSVM